MPILNLDVIISVGYQLKLIKFMTAMARRTSKMLNLSSVANEVGILPNGLHLRCLRAIVMLVF